LEGGWGWGWGWGWGLGLGPTPTPTPTPTPIYGGYIYDNILIYYKIYKNFNLNKISKIIINIYNINNKNFIS